jgi:hypothetical protein
VDPFEALLGTFVLTMVRNEPFARLVNSGDLGERRRMTTSTDTGASRLPVTQRLGQPDDVLLPGTIAMIPVAMTSAK